MLGVAQGLVRFAGDPQSVQEHGKFARNRDDGALLFAATTNRIGKEIDRLDEDDGTTLGDNPPLVYGSEDPGLALPALDVVGQMPRVEAARALGISVRRLQDVLKRRSKPRKPLLQQATIRLAKAQLAGGRAAGPGSQRPSRP